MTQNKFIDLTYIDIQINLRLLSDVKEGEKLMITNNKYLKVDQRYMQSIRRHITTDSREKTLQFINHLLENTKELCNNIVSKITSGDNKQIHLEQLINIQSLLKSATNGLSRIITTYSNDKHNHATIDTYISSINIFCDQYLKQAII